MSTGSESFCTSSVASGAHEPVGSNCADASAAPSATIDTPSAARRRYRVDEHGVGCSLSPSGSFLKCGSRRTARRKRTGSSMTVVTSSSWPPSANGASGSAPTSWRGRCRASPSSGGSRRGGTVFPSSSCRRRRSPSLVPMRQWTRPARWERSHGAVRAAEAEETRLPAGVGVDAKRVGILPGNVQAAGDAGDLAGPTTTCTAHPRAHPRPESQPLMIEQDDA